MAEQEQTATTIQIVVTELGKAAQIVEIGVGGTAADALNKAGLANPKEGALRINGTEGEMGTALVTGDVVAIVPAIWGGQ